MTCLRLVRRRGPAAAAELSPLLPFLRGERSPRPALPLCIVCTSLMPWAARGSLTPPPKDTVPPRCPGGLHHSLYVIPFAINHCQAPGWPLSQLDACYESWLSSWVVGTHWPTRGGASSVIHTHIHIHMLPERVREHSLVLFVSCKSLHVAIVPLLVPACHDNGELAVISL